MAKGSVKTPFKIKFNWDFSFWDVSEDSALPRGFKVLQHMGLGNAKVRMKVGMTAPGGTLGSGATTVEVPFGLTRKKKGKQFDLFTELAPLTDERNDGMFDLHLIAPANHDCRNPAGPHTECPRAEAAWNKVWEVQFRSLVFPNLVVDADGFFNVHDADVILPCRVEPPHDTRGVAPHGYIRIFRPEGTGTARSQRIEVDVRFDVLRPRDPRKEGGGSTHSWNEFFTDDNPHGRRFKRGQFRTKFDTPYLVIHCTTWVPESEREAENERREAQRAKSGKAKPSNLGMGSTYIGSQLQQLTSFASIHYIVNIDGHVVKILEEDVGAWHAGFTDGAGWRNYKIGNATNANKSSIGIEHVAAANIDWSDEQKDGSVRLVRDIVNHFGILPCDVVRHRDLNFDKTDHTHMGGKPCPGSAVPWDRFQDEGLTLWIKGDHDDEPEIEIAKPDLYGGVFDVVDFLDEPLSGTDDTADNRALLGDAIEAVKKDIQRIGHWCINKRKTNLRDADDALSYCARMIQEKYMQARGTTVEAEGRIDEHTARVIARIAAHEEDVLPAL